VALAANTHTHELEVQLMVFSVVVAFFGIFVAYYFYVRRTSLPEKLAATFSAGYRLLYRKYYVDEAYDVLFVNRFKDAGTALAAFDLGVIDGWGVNGSSWLTRFTAGRSMWTDNWIVDGAVRAFGFFVRLLSYPARMIQVGFVQGYALLIVVGVLLLLGYYLLQ
jgi:NADH-quinone oxidoreductase subunit L